MPISAEQSPGNTFFGLQSEATGINPAKLRALKMVQELAGQLPADEVASLYRQEISMTALRIASVFLPGQVVEDHPKIAESAVRLVLAAAIPPGEYGQLVEAHRAAYEAERQRTGYYQSEKHKRVCRLGAQARKKGRTSEERQIMAARIIAAKGDRPWTDEERDFLTSLLDKPEFIHAKGSWFSKPNLKKMAQTLSEHFGHERTRLAVFNCLKKLKEKK